MWDTVRRYYHSHYDKNQFRKTECLAYANIIHQRLRKIRFQRPDGHSVIIYMICWKWQEVAERQLGFKTHVANECFGWPCLAAEMNGASFTIVNKRPSAHNPRGRLDCPAWSGADWFPAEAGGTGLRASRVSSWQGACPLITILLSLGVDCLGGTVLSPSSFRTLLRTLWAKSHCPRGTQMLKDPSNPMPLLKGQSWDLNSEAPLTQKTWIWSTLLCFL